MLTFLAGIAVGWNDAGLATGPPEAGDATGGRLRPILSVGDGN